MTYLAGCHVTYIKTQWNYLQCEHNPRSSPSVPRYCWFGFLSKRGDIWEHRIWVVHWDVSTYSELYFSLKSCHLKIFKNSFFVHVQHKWKYFPFINVQQKLATPRYLTTFSNRPLAAEFLFWTPVDGKKTLHIQSQTRGAIWQSESFCENVNWIAVGYFGDGILMCW